MLRQVYFEGLSFRTHCICIQILELFNLLAKSYVPTPFWLLPLPDAIDIAIYDCLPMHKVHRKKSGEHTCSRTIKPYD